MELEVIVMVFILGLSLIIIYYNMTPTKAPTKKESFDPIIFGYEGESTPFSPSIRGVPMIKAKCIHKNCVLRNPLVV